MSQAWDSIGELQRQVDRLLRNLDPLAGRSLLRPFPAINIHDRGDAFVLLARIPGASAEDVEVSITGESLVLRGDQRRPESVGDEAYRRQERPLGRWSRSVTLPGRIDADAVTAECVDGLLVIVLPRADDAKPRRIVVSPVAG